MLHDNWLDIPCVVILHPFCFKPWMVSDKNTRRNIFTIIFLCSFHKSIIAKRWNSCYLPKVLVLGQKLILGKPSNCVKLVRWFPLQHQPLCTYLKIHPHEICNIYDKYMHLQPPFQIFVNREYEGVDDLVCGNVGQTIWFRRFLMWAWIWWGVHEITSMLIDAIFLFRLKGCFFLNL